MNEWIGFLFSKTFVLQVMIKKKRKLNLKKSSTSAVCKSCVPYVMGSLQSCMLA